MSSLPFRQIHLDFHTSPAIPGVGADFDPEQFIGALRLGHVNSVTVFAKCHHGLSYYPTQIGTVHPSLERDLLGEMVTACRAAGIRVGAYTTLVWDEHAWATHPEWRSIAPDGRTSIPAGTPLRPGWKDLDMNTTYADYVIAQIEEFMRAYDIDEVFIDIVRYSHPSVNTHTLAEMVAEGVNPEDDRALRLHMLELERRFMRKCTAAIRAIKPAMGIFYNSRLRVEYDPALGNRPEMDNFTHLEIESLPGGQWGYDHFPLFARYFQSYDTELLAMTGRFHTTWGDFGGLRNRAALEFECFQGLAHGTKISIGDQLHPRGRMDEAVYARIGEVYAEVERREAWVEGSVALPEIAFITANGGPGLRGVEIPDADVGALHALEQLHHQFAVLDAGDDLTPYQVVILNEGVALTADLEARIRAYVADGGSLLIVGAGGFDPARGDFPLADLMGAQYAGPAPFAPDYLLLAEEIASGIEPMAHSAERPGFTLDPEAGVTVLATSGAPYFNRTWAHFCSHQYTPFDADSGQPIIIQKGRVITIARPLLREYGETSKRVHKQIIGNCLARLLPQPRIGGGNLPSTAIVTVRQLGGDLIVHLLHYVHQRRGAALDIIEDVLPLHNVEVRVRADHNPAAARLVPEGQLIDMRYHNGYVTFTVGKVDGYQIIQLEGAAGS